MADGRSLARPSLRHRCLAYAGADWHPVAAWHGHVEALKTRLHEFQNGATDSLIATKKYLTLKFPAQNRPGIDRRCCIEPRWAALCFKCPISCAGTQRRHTRSRPSRGTADRGPCCSLTNMSADLRTLNSPSPNRPCCHRAKGQ